MQINIYVCMYEFHCLCLKCKLFAMLGFYLKYYHLKIK